MSILKKISLAGLFIGASSGGAMAQPPVPPTGYNPNGVDFAPYRLPNSRKQIRVDADYLGNDGALTVGFMAQFDPQFLYFLNQVQGQNSDFEMESFLGRVLPAEDAKKVSRTITHMAENKILDLTKFKELLKQDFYTEKGQATKALALVILHSDSKKHKHLQAFQAHLKMDYPRHFDALMQDVVKFYKASKEMVIANNPQP